MGKASFPKELLGNSINKNNREWLDEYKKETNLGRGYLQKLENFFRFRDYINIPFNNFTKLDIDKYIEIMVDNDYKTDTINAIPAMLSGFKNFLHAKHPSVFQSSFLSELPSKYFDSSEPSDAFVLSVTQINLIRKYNQKNFLYEYIFELYFQLGIKKKELEHCQPKNSNKELSCFITAKGKEIKYNAKVLELLNKTPFKEWLKLSEATVNYYLLKLTEYLREQTPTAYTKDRPLNYSDVLKSHHRYILECPSCGQLTENVAKDWVLAKTITDSDFRLACSQCKGVYYGD